MPRRARFNFAGRPTAARQSVASKPKMAVEPLVGFVFGIGAVRRVGSVAPAAATPTIRKRTEGRSRPGSEPPVGLLSGGTPPRSRTVATVASGRWFGFSFARGGFRSCGARPGGRGIGNGPSNEEERDPSSARTRWRSGPRGHLGPGPPRAR